MNKQAFEIINTIEDELTSLTFARRMLNEVFNSLSPIISFDKSKEDEERIQNLLNRRGILEDFVNIATDYIVHAQEALSSVVDKYIGGGV